MGVSFVLCEKTINSSLMPSFIAFREVDASIAIIKIEYHAVGDTWWQPLLSYGK